MVCYKRGWRSIPYYKLIFRRGTQFSRELSCLAAWNYLGRIKMDLGLLVYASESCVSCQNGYTRPEWAYHGSNTSLRDYPASSLMCHCEKLSRVSEGFVQGVEYLVTWSTVNFVFYWRFCLLMYTGVEWASIFAFWVSIQKLGKCLNIWLSNYVLL